MGNISTILLLSVFICTVCDSFCVILPSLLSVLALAWLGQCVVSPDIDHWSEAVSEFLISWESWWLGFMFTLLYLVIPLFSKESLELAFFKEEHLDAAHPRAFLPTSTAWPVAGRFRENRSRRLLQRFTFQKSKMEECKNTNYEHSILADHCVCWKKFSFPKKEIPKDNTQTLKQNMSLDV